MEYFGSKITREIWSSPENIVLIYVGSAADFALNPENNWLFYTMRLPNDPQKRFIETFKHNQAIFFTPAEQVPAMLQKIREVHNRLEQSRTIKESAERKISNVAFKEVGDMLIAYGIRGYEYLNRRMLSDSEKQQYYSDMKASFEMMNITDLPELYEDWREWRDDDIKARLAKNEFTDKLYAAYRKDIGWLRYRVVLLFQGWFVNKEISRKLGIGKNPLFGPLYKLYPYIRSDFLFSLLIRFLVKPETAKVLREFKAVTDQSSTSSFHSGT